MSAIDHLADVDRALERAFASDQPVRANAPTYPLDQAIGLWPQWGAAKHHHPVMGTTVEENSARLLA